MTRAYNEETWKRLFDTVGMYCEVTKENNVYHAVLRRDGGGLMSHGYAYTPLEAMERAASRQPLDWRSLWEKLEDEAVTAISAL